MTALAIEPSAPALRPARRALARRPRLAVAAPAQLPQYVPAWLMPELHTDPRFAQLAAMSSMEIGMALLASGEDWHAYRVELRRRGARRPVEYYITAALRGLDATGPAAVREAAARYKQALYEAGPFPNLYRIYLGVVPTDSVLHPYFALGATRYDRRAAIDLALFIRLYGFRHDLQVEQVKQATGEDSSRCTGAGICAHCHPQNFPTTHHQAATA